MVVKIQTFDIADTFVQKIVKLCLKVDRLGVVTVRNNNFFIVRSSKYLEISKALEESGMTLYIKNIEVIEKEKAPYVYILDEVEPSNTGSSAQESL